MTFIASVDAMSNFLRQEAPDLWRPGWSCGIRCNFIPTSQEYRKVPTEIVATLPYIYTYNIYIYVALIYALTRTMMINSILGFCFRGAAALFKGYLQLMLSNEVEPAVITHMKKLIYAQPLVTRKRKHMDLQTRLCWISYPCSKPIRIHWYKLEGVNYGQNLQ